MPGGDADAVVPNLPSLREALTGKADAIELAAAFGATTLQDARAALRRVVADWSASAKRPASPTGQDQAKPSGSAEAGG